MGWKKIETLRCLVREDKRLRLTCECGHIAEPDTRELIEAIYQRHNDWWASLTDLPKHLRCGQCGSKSFTYELVPLLP
jgi:hypothetical protein